MPALEPSALRHATRKPLLCPERTKGNVGIIHQTQPKGHKNDRLLRELQKGQGGCSRSRVNNRAHSHARPTQRAPRSPAALSRALSTLFLQPSHQFWEAAITRLLFQVRKRVPQLT